MPTSGNTIKVLNRDDIIKSALRKLVVISEGQLPSAEQTATAAEALNTLVAEYRTLGLSVFARTEYILAPVLQQFDYMFGVGEEINIPYPMYIYDAYLTIPPAYVTKQPLNYYPIVDFNDLPLAYGMPVNFTYQPMLNKGKLSIWPAPDASIPDGVRIHITYQRPIEVFDTATDDMDFPQEWGNALIYGLALLLADEYGVPDSKFGRLQKQADLHLGIAAANSTEQGSLYLQPDVDWSR